MSGENVRSKKATAGGGKDAWDAPAYAFPCSASCPVGFQGAAGPAVSRWVAVQWTAETSARGLCWPCAHSLHLLKLLLLPSWDALLADSPALEGRLCPHLQ